MCDMQKMPRDDEDVTLEEDSEMNFAAFSTSGGGGAHFVTSTGQIAKLQQNVINNGSTLSQVVGMVSGVNMVDGVQYVRALDGSGSMQSGPQIISVPISLPSTKPGDPQPTVQIQVLNPNMLQTQQQPKYQMQIPIQGFQQGAVLTVAYSPDTNESGGLQILGNGLPEGLQVLAALPPEMQMMHAQAQGQENKDNIIQHQQQAMQQVIFTQNQQIVINGANDKILNNNNNNNNSDVNEIIIKEECEDNNDDESSQGTENSDSISWTMNSTSHQDLLKYLNSLPPQQTLALPGPLQQFLRLNPSDVKKQEPMEVEMEPAESNKDDTIAEAVLGEDGTLRITNKKKKKYKRKPAKPAKPKPGQVVIAKAADGSTIYCCPECQMAYSDKEQLEVHLVVHKIERRYICGICGAGLKRKEHLERHKMGHNPERPYVCSVCRKGFKRREHLNLHAVIHSGVKTEMCTLCGKGFYRKDHLRKHTRSHETRRLRDEGADLAPDLPRPQPASHDNITILPEITINVPTSANVNVPVQINIPQHVVSSLTAQQAAGSDTHTHTHTHTQLDALLAQHT